MGIMEILGVAYPLVVKAYHMAKNAGIIGSPDWIKHMDDGMRVLKTAIEISDSIAKGSTDYDKLTPEEILTLLKSKSVSDLEKEVADEDDSADV